MASGGAISHRRGRENGGIARILADSASRTGPEQGSAALIQVIVALVGGA